jgi:Glu-tRNA(Gln) amidotransferase subunit E-like FAD-binding protein
MWWLFLNDRIYNENDITYAKHNDMIINKNMNSIPKQLIDRFEYTLLEYKRNKIILKDVLKIQLNSLYDEFINNKEIIDLKKIDCNIFRVERKDQEIQNGVKMRLKITCDQSNQTNLKTKNFSTQTESLDEENEDSDLDIVCEEILDEIVISELCDEIINRDDSTDEI